MANPQKGEVLVQSAAGEFILVYTLGALAAIEGQFPGRSFNEILADLDGDHPKIQTLIVVIWAGLRRHHPDLSQEDVGDIIILPEVATVWAPKLAEALQLAKPEGEAKGNPRVAPAK